MKRFITLLIVAILCCSTIFVPTFAESSPAIKEEYLNEDKWLTLSTNKEGPRYFVDMKGNPVNLFGQARCQSHAGAENLLYSPTASVDALTEHYADYGTNFMRLAINLSSLCGGEKRTPEQIKTFISKSVDPDVQAIIRNGMYVMLDCHMYPDVGEGASAEETVQFARDYYLPFLIELAKTYKDEPMVAVIEIWNEPYPADMKQLTFDKNLWNTLLRQYFIDAVAEIRKIDTRHVLLVSDWNAGWGAAMPETWGGYWDKVDPVYQNTCFSVHASHSQLDNSYTWYSNWWLNIAKDNNVCLLFGEIETEPGISTDQGMKNFFNFLSKYEDEYHFSACIWRPHGQNQEYHYLWADTGWADEYCKPDPIPTTRYTSDTEDVFQEKSSVVEVTKDTTFFGSDEYGTGISMLPGLSATQYQESTIEVLNNVVYRAGDYKLLVRAAGKAGYTGDFIVGYRDVKGEIHQIARFPGKNSNMVPYYQSVEFTAAEQIASFVYFSCEAKEKSVFIDRVILTGEEAHDETSMRNRITIEPVNKITELSGKVHTIKVDTPEADDEDEDYSDDEYEDEQEEETNEPVQQVIVKSPDKTTLLRHKIINKNAKNLTIMMFVALGVLLVAGVFILVNFIVSKRKSKIK